MWLLSLSVWPSSAASWSPARRSAVAREIVTSGAGASVLPLAGGRVERAVGEEHDGHTVPWHRRTRRRNRGHVARHPPSTSVESSGVPAMARPAPPASAVARTIAAGPLTFRPLASGQPKRTAAASRPSRSMRTSPSRWPCSSNVATSSETVPANRSATRVVSARIPVGTPSVRACARRGLDLGLLACRDPPVVARSPPGSGRRRSRPAARRGRRSAAQQSPRPRRGEGPCRRSWIGAEHDSWRAPQRHLSQPDGSGPARPV